MRHNYIMLPENYQRQSLRGHRHRPNKDKNVDGAFTPVSRAGRLVPGDAKVKTTMANKAKKVEERSVADLFKFVKKLNKVIAARRIPTLPGGEQMEVKATPKLIPKTEEGGSGSLPSQLLQKRPIADSVKPYTYEVISVRVVRRARSNAMSSSSRVKPENMPQLPSTVGSTEDTINLVANTVSASAYDSPPRSFIGEHSRDHELITTTDTVQQNVPFPENAVYGIVPPVFLGHPATHQIANLPNFISPEHETPKWPVEPFWLNAGPAPGFLLLETRNDENAELEHVATACAYAGMGEPMEVDPEFPTFIHNNTYVDLDLERVAVACAYAGMDEPMDTTLDDTRGPVFNDVPQELQMVDQACFAQYIPLLQQAQFELDVGVQPQMYQTAQHLEQQYFIDQDQRLRPPYHIDQPFQQEHYVVFPPHLPVQANNYPVIEEYFPAVTPFNIDHGTRIHADVPLPPMIHNQPVDGQFEPYHRIPEEVANQLHVLPVVTEMDEKTRYEDAGETEQLGHCSGFLKGKTGEPDHARLFEDLFGIEDVDDDDDDSDGEVEIII